MRFLFLLFIVMPIVEMWLLIQVGQQIGSVATIGLVLLTAAVGFGLLRQQGFAMLFRARQKLDSGELPAGEVAEAIILAVSGALLLTPGFVTDAIGFVGLVPVLRRGVAGYILSRMQVVSARQYQGYQQSQHGGDSGAPENKDPRTLEGEFWREDDKDP